LGTGGSSSRTITCGEPTENRKDLNGRGPESKYERKEYQKHVEAASEAGSGYFVTPFPATNYLGSLLDFAENIIPSYAK
jgi:hypothetical protein